MSTRAIRIVVAIAICHFNFPLLASEWAILEPSGSLKEYRDTTIGNVAIEIHRQKNPLLVVESQHLEISLGSLSYVNSIILHSAELVEDLESLQLQVVFSCVGGEGFIAIPIQSSSKSKMVSLGNVVNSGCNDS